jgi:transposase
MDGKRKFSVHLTAAQRDRFETLTGTGARPAREIRHARILLMADKDDVRGRYKDVEIARAVGVHVNTVAKTRVKFCRRGEAAAVQRKARATPPVPAKVDGALEAQLVAICCTPAPAGRRCWTMSLLAEELVKRKLVVRIGRETVRKTLKKTSSGPGGPSGSASPNATRPGSSPRWNASWTSTRCPRTTPSR